MNAIGGVLAGAGLIGVPLLGAVLAPLVGPLEVFEGRAGMLFLTVPAIILCLGLTCMLQVSVAACVAERRGVVASLSRSRVPPPAGAGGCSA